MVMILRRKRNLW